MNWATFLTLGRIALVPLFVYLMYAGTVQDAEPALTLGSWLALVVFVVAAITDSLDGYLARRHERVTKLGQFLDPLADKILIGAALVTLVALRGFPAWGAVVIVVREIAVSLLRAMAARRGRSLPASKLGKAKTVAQIATVMAWLLPRFGSVAVVQDFTLYLAVALTVASGAVYFSRASELLASSDDRSSGR